MKDRVDFIFNGGKTKRFHTADTLTEQTVADHSFGVAWLCYLIEGKAVRRELLLAALAHDLAEHITGDVSSVMKHEHPVIGELFHEVETKHLSSLGLNFEEGLTPEETRTLKFADLLDGMLYCVRDRRLGNVGITYVYNNFAKYAMERHPSASVRSLMGRINQLWNEANDASSERVTSGRKSLQVELSALGFCNGRGVGVPTRAGDEIPSEVEEEERHTGLKEGATLPS